MKIYTKTGDSGETGLFGGERVPKDHLRIQAYGTLDELNAVLGTVLAYDSISQDLRLRLNRVQAELFQLGAELATPRGKRQTSEPVTEKQVERLEKEIDAMEATLPALRTFILPGGTHAAAALHLSRTVCRRAERETFSLHRSEPVRPEVIRYLNRLSDYLFVCARFANGEAGVPEIPWIAPSVKV